MHTRLIVWGRRGLVLCAFIWWVWAAYAAPSEDPVTIVVDPGHGGRDPGVRGPEGLMEKDLVLELSRDMREELGATRALEILLTRERDESTPWSQRRRLSHGAELWISLHLNAELGGKARGPRVFYALGAHHGPNETSTANRPDVEAILQDMARTKRENEAILLGEHIRRALEAAWGVSSRPSRAAPLRELAELETPAVLVEVGFLTDKADRTALADPERRRQLAKAILRGVRSFLVDPRREP